MPEDALIPVKLARVVLRKSEAQQWIFLQEVDGERGFPIVIGTHEAEEIDRVLNNLELPRPLTHQLTLAAVEALEAKLIGVDIVDLRKNTFYARLRLQRPGSADSTAEVHVDARPSDALALALRAGASLRVVESDLEQARTDEAPDSLPPPPPEGDDDE